MDDGLKLEDEDRFEEPGARGADQERGGADADDLPPDSGPEQFVAKVRPCFWRGRPVSSVFLALLPVAVVIGLMFLPAASWKWQVVGTLGLVMAVLCWGTLGVWWVTISLAQSLRVTNKRIESRRGLISRSTNEVLHDHIRNVQVDQSVVDRVMRVGRIGISSSGQDEIEIQMEDIPDPHKLAKILDRYRELG